MKKKLPKPLNPFPVVGYNGPDYFCNREKEIHTLKSAITNGRNVSLIAKRRIGKSSLLEHLQYSFQSSGKRWKVFYIDLIKTSTLEDLYKLLAHALYESKSKGFFNKLTDMEIFSRLRLTIGVNLLTQLPELSFEIKESQTKQSFASLLDWIATEQYVLIIFDEFQQILSYPLKNTEGFLRSEMMRLPNVRFIFCGSDQHLLDEMFRSHSRPFFNSTQVMGMEEIHSDSYSSFIKKHFKDAKRTISDDAIAYVLHVTGNETYAVQKICNAIFESNIPNVTLPVVKEIFKKVLIEQQSYFERIRTLLKADSVQFKLLRAVAKQDIVLEPTGKKFMSSNSFTNSSSVLKALKSLESYSLISKVIVENKGLGYYINDALFRAWLSTLPV